MDCTGDWADEGVIKRKTSDGFTSLVVVIGSLYIRHQGNCGPDAKGPMVVWKVAGGQVKGKDIY